MGRSRRLGAGAVAVLGAAVGSLMLSGPGEAAAGSAQLLISHAPDARVTQSTSSNWGGYNQGAIEKGKQFKAVSGTWNVPTATAHKPGEAEYSSVWVGIGGGCVDVRCNVGDSTLIQAGTAQTVNEPGFGPVHYYAWYELIPKAETRILSLPVAPGQKITVSIKELTRNSWSIVMRNLTTGRSFSKNVTYASTHATAEWIEETPTLFVNGHQKLAVLPKLSKVTFTAATVNGAPAGLVAKEEMRLVRNGAVWVDPSAPHGSGSFNACSYTASCS